jgi:hypothetical protein
MPTAGPTRKWRGLSLSRRKRLSLSRVPHVCPRGATKARPRSTSPRVERAVQYVRGNFWAGESFTDLADAQNRVEIWCRETAGMRVHGTTARRPAEMFAELEAGCLLPLPEPYDQPVFTRVNPPRLPRGSRPGVVLGAGASARLEPGRPRRQPARVLSSPSRRPYITRRAMISRTQVRSGQRDRHASAPCASGSGPRRDRSQPGRCPHTAPLRGPPPRRHEHRRP